MTEHNHSGSAPPSHLNKMCLTALLGPILFNIHVSDMASHINNCLLVQYADDTQFLHSGNISEIDTLINRTENTFTQIRSYSLKNDLRLNIDKTQCIFLGTRQVLAHRPDNTIIIRCDDSDIRPSLNAENLGIYLDSYMTFDRHESNMIKKIMGNLMFINRNQDYFDKETRVTILQTLVLSTLKYGITIWGTTNSTVIKKVQKYKTLQ